MSAGVNDLWQAGDEAAWQRAVDHSWDLVKPSLLGLDREMDRLTPAVVASMTAEEWCAFLREKFFRWKYRAANRYVTSVRHLLRHIEGSGAQDLDRIRRSILEPACPNIGSRLRTVMEIGGVGAAGASGLLALLYPAEFGTVDQFVVKALRDLPDLPEHEVLLAMNPEVLGVSDAVLLTLLLRRKAAELNARFGTTAWTPRKLDVALWAVGRQPGSGPRRPRAASRG